ncbi:MAG: SCO family protein [Bacteroidia bacterium]
MKLAATLFSFILFISACNTGTKKLPYLSVLSTDNGDTVFREYPEFEFINQDAKKVTHETFAGKVYVADFFFVSCPTICPIMSKNLKKVYEKYNDREDFLILSHSIDTRHDSVPVLNEYASRLGVTSDTWHFVTGKKDDIYSIGYNFYMATIQEDDSPGSGGYLHSGGLILVDKKGKIRGVYDGTNDSQVGQLIADLKYLLK